MQTSLNSYSTRKCFKINHCCMEFGFTVSISHTDHLFHSQSLRIITGNHRGKQENQAITKQKKKNLLFDMRKIGDATDYF